MLNLVWPIFIIISIIFSFLTGSVKQLNSSIFESTEAAVSLCITLVGTMCLWSGVMQIAAKTSAMQRITSFLRPIMKLLFPKLKRESKIYQEISMNMVANILGLGNAATPLGIKAMKSMQEENNNKKVITNEMATFIVLNTASIQLIPTTVIAIRSSLGSENPTAIIIPVWIATICAACAGIIATKIFIKLGK
ncbi:MAG: nucleoside recognition protein [Clostridia bacterium]|nr:nucleoside recognition protein [Clostridia bacterium]